MYRQARPVIHHIVANDPGRKNASARDLQDVDGRVITGSFGPSCSGRPCRN